MPFSVYRKRRKRQLEGCLFLFILKIFRTCPKYSGGDYIFLSRAKKRRIVLDLSKVVDKLHQGQKGLLKEVLKGEKKYFALMAHRRYGKDFISFIILLICAILHPGNYYIFAPFFRQAKEIVIDGKTLDGLPLVDNLIPRELLKNPKAPSVFNKSDWSCELFNGSKIFIRGADNPDSNVGVGARGIIYTEAALMKPNFYQLMKPAVDRVIHATGFGVVIFISTPRGKNNWFTKLFLDYFNILSNPKYERIKKKWYIDVQKASESKDWKGDPVMSEDELEEQRLSMTPENFEQEYECACNLSVIGAWYGKEIDEAYRDKRIGAYGHYEEVCDRGRYYKEYTGYYWSQAPLYVGWDIGKRDHTVIWLYQINPHNMRPRFIWHYRATGVGPQHMVMELRKYCRKKGLNGYRLNILPHDGDVEEWTASSKRSDIIRDMGEDVYTLSKSDLAKEDMIKLIAQINAIRQNFKHVEIDDSECHMGVIKLQEYVKKFNKSLGEYMDVVDHDANDKASDDADAFRTAMIYWINNLKDKGEGYGAITTEGKDITFGTAETYEDINYFDELSGYDDFLY